MTANSTENSKRVVGRPFAPGQSGNPNGRRKLSPEAKLILSDENIGKVLEALFKTACDRRNKNHVKAAVAFLDRALGKPLQQIAGADGGPIVVRTTTDVRQMTDDELLAEATEIVRRKTNTKGAEA